MLLVVVMATLVCSTPLVVLASAPNTVEMRQSLKKFATKAHLRPIDRNRFENEIANKVSLYSAFFNESEVDGDRVFAYLKWDAQSICASAQCRVCVWLNPTTTGRQLMMEKMLRSRGFIPEFFSESVSSATSKKVPQPKPQVLSGVALRGILARHSACPSFLHWVQMPDHHYVQWITLVGDVSKKYERYFTARIPINTNSDEELTWVQLLIQLTRGTAP